MKLVLLEDINLGENTVKNTDINRNLFGYLHTMTKSSAYVCVHLPFQGYFMNIKIPCKIPKKVFELL
eukprot:snap_masked-scaffold_1-processed-gene-24.24-mRNA-1 protein AED:1.00 eAED:1.00 QI:0/0/0/0/1/1/2/0/66